MLRLRVKHLISGVLSVATWCVVFVFGHRYDADANPVVGGKLTCGKPGSFTNSNRVSTGYSFEDASGTAVCVFVCQPGYATYIPCSSTAYTGCGRAYTGTNDSAWNMWINTECSTGCAYSGYESLDAATTGLTNAVYNKIGAGLYFYTGCKTCSYDTPPQNCVAVRSYVKFSCGAGSPNSSAVSSGKYVGAVGALAGASITLPAASNCTAPAGQSFSQWIGS